MTAALHETLNGVRLSWYDVTYLEVQPTAKYGMSRQSRQRAMVKKALRCGKLYGLLQSKKNMSFCFGYNALS